LELSVRYRPRERIVKILDTADPRLPMYPASIIEMMLKMWRVFWS
jgi:hypothetical protein